MTQIKKMHRMSDGVQIYPQTHTKAVIDDNGYTAESRLGAMQDEINQAQLAVGAVPSDLTPTKDSTNWVTSGGVYAIINEIRTDIKALYNSLGNYAFTNGKPSFPWVGDISITNTLSNVVSSNYREFVNSGESYTTTLSGVGLYAIDDSSVIVTMGGIDVTSSVYNSTTHTITINSVSGAITITASGITYVENGLVFQLDGLQKGPTAGKWTDLKGGVVWDNHGATELSDCWQFDGTSYLDSQNMVAHEPRTCTIEVVIDSGLTNTTYHVFTDGSKMVLNYTHNYKSKDLWISRGHTNSVGYGGITISTTLGGDTGHGKKIVAVTGNNNNEFGGIVNGESRTATSINYGAGAKALIGGQWGSTSNALNLPFTGKIYAIRIYDTILTEAQMLANQRLDNQRFNLGLTI